MIEDYFINLAFSDAPMQDTSRIKEYCTIYRNVDECLSYVLWGIRKGDRTLSTCTASLNKPLKRLPAAFEENDLTPLHQHNYIELLYVAQGSFSQKIEGKDFLFRAGDIVFINRGVLHNDYLRELDACIVFLNIPNQLFKWIFKTVEHSLDHNYILKLLLERNPNCSHIHGSLKPQLSGTEMKTARALYEIVKEITHPAPGSTQITNGQLIRLMDSIAKEYKFTLSKHTRDDMRKQLCAEIVENIVQDCRDITIETLQQKYFFNRDYFNRLIKEYIGVTFRELRQNIRLSKCIYRTELATCTEKTSHLAGDFPPLRRRRLPVQKAGPIL